LGKEERGCLRKGLPGKRQEGDTPLFTLEGKLRLQQVGEQGFAEIRQSFLAQLKKTIEGLLGAERDRRVAAWRQRGEKV
jgi:hypothetical protein